MTRRVLVTGASGLLGSNIARTLADDGCEVAGAFHANAVELPGVRLVSCDVRNESEVKKLFSEARPERVYHCAAATNVDACEDDTAGATALNVDAARFVAASAAAAGAKLVHISTDSVYADVEGAHSEETETGPLNGYARTKLAGDLAVLKANPAALIVRTNIYGWNVRDKMSFAEALLHGLLEGKSLTLFSDVQFSPILVNDLLDVSDALIEAGATGIYNAGARDGVDKHEFGHRVAKLFSLRAETLSAISLASKQLKAPRPRIMLLSVEKAEAKIGRSLPTVDEGLHRFLSLLESGYVSRLKGRTISGPEDVWRKSPA